MLTFSNGHTMDFCCGSGALAFDGRGWFWEWPLRWAGLIDPKALTVVAKTVTLQPRRGNLRWLHPWTCVRLLPGGAVNAVGLTNGGLDWWLAGPYQRAVRHGFDLAASVYPLDRTEAARMGAALADRKLVYVELNPSCPNVKRETDPDHAIRLLDGLAETCPHPLVIKLSHAQAMNVDFLSALRDADRVEAVHAINTVAWERIFTGKRSPLVKHTGSAGGISGAYIKPHALEAITHVKRITGLPVIGGGGIMRLEDLADYADAGADAFSIGTLFLKRPWVPNRIIRAYRSEKVSEGAVKRIESSVGSS